MIGHSIRFIALKYLKNEEDSEDLEQDFWANIYSIADRYTYISNGFSYLCKIMNNMAINRYKKLHGEKQHIVEVVDYNRIHLFDENETIANLDDRIAVQKALDKLDSMEHQVMQLIIFEDMTIEQISKELKISKSKVGRIKLVALEKLKQELSQYAWEKSES